MKYATIICDFFVKHYTTMHATWLDLIVSFHIITGFYFSKLFYSKRR